MDFEFETEGKTLFPRSETEILVEKALEAIDENNLFGSFCNILDIGTGSGILMIAAAKLGAGTICGIDTDEVAVEVAEKNLLLNNVPKDQFSLYTNDLVGRMNERFDVVVANILSEVIVRLLDDIHLVMSENTFLICSGIIERNGPKVIEKMKRGIV